ncbi:MAG: penicillin-binding transpeptidase domain-containing protein [Actinomycetota bacterium]
MNRSVRRVALAIGIAFAALIAQLAYVQVFSAERLSENPANRRLLIKEYSIERGAIVAGADVVARSVPTKDNLKFLREYKLRSLYGQISGYYSIVFGRAGLEQSYNDYLIGAGPQDRFSSIVDDLLGRSRKGNDIQLTIDPELQRLARSKLGKQRGAAVAIDPETGEILAMYANPSFDPSPLSSHNTQAVRTAWNRFNADPLKPLTSRATQERYPPGSTMKVIVAAAALEDGIKATDRFSNPRALKLPLTTRTLPNFGGGACRGGGTISMAQGLRVSCNTTFAQIGMKVGPEKLDAMARKFGFGDPLRGFDLPSAPSCFVSIPGAACGDPNLNAPQTAFSSIGQQDVRATPLQMAIVAATIANGGRVPQPHVVREIQDASGRTIKRITLPLSERIYSTETADTLRDMMIDVVDNGTGRPAAISSLRGEMGGKTGTAQTGIEGQAPHVWFIAFAPGIAVAVVVENGGDLADAATGGKVAGPIAKALIEKRIAKEPPR